MSLQIVNEQTRIQYPCLYLAVNYHKTHKNNNISFVDMPYLIDIYKDNSENQCLIKSTQSGITEWLIIKSIVQTYYKKRNLFYVMPTENLKNQFVSTRFDMSSKYTSRYKNMFKDAEFNNMSIKQVGMASIFFAVSNSRNNFTSFPADDLIIDEVDECNQENLEMAPERLAFCKNPTETRVGNPTIPDFGIDWWYQLSDKKSWYIKCEACGHHVNPDFFKNVVEEVDEDKFEIKDKDFEQHGKQDIRLICDKCGLPINRFKKGEWVSQTNSLISGRHLNQLFTSNVKIRDIVHKFNAALSSEIKMQRFYNGILGLPYVGRGAKITDDILSQCMRDFSLQNECKDPCVIGIDVGNKLHVVILKIVQRESIKLQLVYANELRFAVRGNKIDLSELIALNRRFNIKAGLVDSRPEVRLSKLICQNFKNIWRCDYLTDNLVDQVNFNAKTYKTDRTTSMDSIKELFVLENLLLPKNIKRIPGFFDHLKAPVRVFKESHNEKAGRWIWVEGNKPDHYFHALNYANVSKKLLLAGA